MPVWVGVGVVHLVVSVVVPLAVVDLSTEDEVLVETLFPNALTQ
jgi:hypothetical protein